WVLRMARAIRSRAISASAPSGNNRKQKSLLVVLGKRKAADNMVRCFPNITGFKLHLDLSEADWRTSFFYSSTNLTILVFTLAEYAPDFHSFRLISPHNIERKEHTMLQPKARARGHCSSYVFNRGGTLFKLSEKILYHRSNSQTHTSQIAEIKQF
ncbi:hypothetical protein WKW50_25755, partial [Ochrobactrum sp. GPK 3]